MRMRFLKQLIVVALIGDGPFFLPTAPVLAQAEDADDEEGDDEDDDNGRQDDRQDRQDAHQGAPVRR